MKKIVFLMSILFLVSTANAFDKGFATKQVSDAQVLSRGVVLYGFDIRTDGTNAVEIRLYDTSSYLTVTGSLIGPVYYITTSATDRMQARNFPIPVQVTAGGVYVDVTTTGSHQITLYYNLSKYRGYD